MPGPDVTIDDVIAAYETQCEAVEATGGRVILMASRALAKAAKGPDDYARVYERVLGGLSSPRSCTGWARCSIRRSKAIGARPTTWPRWTPA
jgi:hypothetical protein